MASIQTASTFFSFKKFKWLARGIVVALPILVLWEVFLPPLGGIAPPAVAEIPHVAEADNAAVEYVEAVRECTHTKNGKAAPLVVIDPDCWANQGSHFLPDQLAYLDRFAASARHLEMGATRPKFQYYTEAPTVETPGFDLIELRDMIRHAVALGLAQVQRGQVVEGVRLLLAAYRCGSAWASEPVCPLSQGLNGVGNRKLVTGALFYVMHKTTLSRPLLLQIAREVARNDSALVPPARYLELEAQGLDRYVYGAATGAPSGEMALLPQALRERCYLGFLTIHQAYVAQRRAFCEAYDVAGATRADREWTESESCRPTLSYWLHHPFPTEVAADAFFEQSGLPNWGRVLAVMYLDRAAARGLQATACLQAYRTEHSAYPAELASAFREAILPLPVDVCTGKPMGYRLEGPRAVAWLPGVDGSDDGGRLDYELRSQTNPNVSMCDLLYTSSEIPTAFRYPLPPQK